MTTRPDEPELLSVATGEPTGVWRKKATVARILQYRQAALRLRAGADTDTRRTLDSWRDVRRQIARLMLATSDGRADPGRVQRLRSLTADKERLERTLAADLPEFARERALAHSPHSRLIEALPAGAVVLDLVAFHRQEQDPRIRGERGRRVTPSYMAFVLSKAQSVRQVDLGPAGPIDEAVRAWRAAIVHRQASPAAEVLRRTVWEPLARHFPPGTTTVLIAPDEGLTAVPWGALPGDRPGTVLLEQYARATVPHAPYVLDRLTAPARSPGEGDLVLAVGGVDYDGMPKPLGDPAARTDLSPGTDTAWEIPAGDAGLEAVVLLAREGSPLPRDIDLAARLAGLSARPGPSLDRAVWIENGREVTLDPQGRAAPSTQTRKSEDPILRIRGLLQDKVQPLADYTQAVVFRNQGGR